MITFERGMTMDAIFTPHNLHRLHPGRFRELDPQLKSLQDLPLVYRFPLLDSIPRNNPGIYSITGGRQVGKTTLLKEFMAELLENNIPASNIVYLPGELIDDHHVLVRVVSQELEYLPESADEDLFFLLLDEVTYTKDWDRGVKYLADAGILRNIVLLLTGSDSVLIREAIMRFPGRRGTADQVDFHLFPLSFAEYFALEQGISSSSIQELAETQDPGRIKELEQAFESYLAHGGYLTAINEFEQHGRIRRATFNTYGDWIRGDILKCGKSENYLREILTALVKRLGSQLTWNTLAADISIDHPATVADYVELLARMDAVFIQAALREDKLIGAPKKARKIHFADPFILHAVRAWLEEVPDPWQQQAAPLLADNEKRAALVESCAVSHFRRYYPTYYIKGAGEVDIAYIKNGRFWPVEIKWSRQIRAAELKQAAKYSNSLICSRVGLPAKVHGIDCEPLVRTLLKLG